MQAMLPEVFLFSQLNVFKLLINQNGRCHPVTAPLAFDKQRFQVRIVLLDDLRRP